MSRDSATLFDIRDAAQQIASFAAGLGADELRADPKTLSAVLYQITILGEAVKRLSPELRAAHPGIPWKDAATTVPALLKQIEPLFE